MRILFTAISGTNVHEALKTISSSLSLSEDIEVKFEEYLINAHEEELHKLGHEESFIDSEIKIIRESGGIQYLCQYPKSYLRSIWIKAFDMMQQNTNEMENVFFSMHSIYFQTQNREFFTAYNPDSLKEFKVDKVITLIDDIYDCHARLRAEGGIMSDASREKTFDEPHKRARARINDLFSILDWRSKEIIAAEQISALLNAQHLVVAVKHPVSVILSLLKYNSQLIYISHPITQVRRLAKQDRKEEADEIERLISELIIELTEGYKEKVTAIFPTSIDELIIKKADSEPGCLPILGKRWPFMFDVDSMMYSKPQQTIENPLDLEHIYFDEKGKMKDNLPEVAFYSIRALINDVLKAGIDAQINSRDHFLVDQCDAICVFRPYFDGNSSHGVAEEIYYRTRRYKCKADKQPKLCVIYCPPDDLAKVRLMEIMNSIDSEAKVKFSNEQRKKMIETAKSDSQTWYRLRDLKPKPWTGVEIKELFAKAEIKVEPPGKMDTGAFRVAEGLQHRKLVDDYWDSMTEELNSHPLNREDIIIEGVDLWIEKEMSPQSVAKIIVEKLTEKKG